MHLRGLGNLCSSAVYNQGQLTNTISCGLQKRLKIELIRQAHNWLQEKANENIGNQRKQIFTNDDVTNYVIGAIQWKLPRAPVPFNPVLVVPNNWTCFFDNFGGSIARLPPCCMVCHCMHNCERRFPVPLWRNYRIRVKS